ncbi:hypothetical protein LUU34_00523600 [Aix galericulata]|nr:hypothetical protein LUU34_00523600 [Aix galericulata]
MAVGLSFWGTARTKFRLGAPRPEHGAPCGAMAVLLGEPSGAGPGLALAAAARGSSGRRWRCPGAISCSVRAAPWRRGRAGRCSPPLRAVASRAGPSRVPHRRHGPDTAGAGSLEHLGGVRRAQAAAAGGRAGGRLGEGGQPRQPAAGAGRVRPGTGRGGEAGRGAGGVAAPSRGAAGSGGGSRGAPAASSGSP